MGVRIGLREPGVTPIHRGRPLRPSPMVEPLWAPVRVEVLSEGPDLVARFYGPPLSAVSRHPDAPEDPVHTWVRLRPRPDDWRVVLTGLGRVNLPAGRVAPTSTGMHLDASPDAFEITVETPVTTTLSADRWTLDTRPALEDHQPYPRVGISWRR